MTHKTNEAIQLYLSKLRQRLGNAPAPVRKAALRDAEEFLRDELQQLATADTISTEQALRYFDQVFGAPVQVARSYLEETEPIGPTAITARSSIPIARKMQFATVMLLIGVMATVGYAMLREPPKLSPFTRVDFDGNRVLVEFEGATSELVAIDDLATNKIVASAKQQFKGRWQKRIAEDLVEVLWGMNHRPGSTVKLRLRNPKTNAERTIDQAPMTEANRNQVWQHCVNAELAGMARNNQNFLPYFRSMLEKRWAYYPLIDQSADEAFQTLQKKIEASDNQVNIGLELQKIIALGIDGHAQVSGSRLPGQCLPFLIEPIGNRYVAFLPDRSQLVDPKHPYIEQIDGISIDHWCEATSILVARGSPQYVKRHALRELRHIDHWRRGLKIPLSDKISVQLASASGEQRAKLAMTTGARKPRYGVWPRSESQILRKENLGYLRLKSMNDEAVQTVRHFMPKFRKTDGLIVDVRDNGGGTRAALRMLFSFLMSPEDRPHVANCAKYRLHPNFDDDHLDARYLYRADAPHWSPEEQESIKNFRETLQPEWNPPTEKFSEWHYMVLNRLDEPSVYHYDKPVVVLMNAKCFSATDIFLAALKGWHNVTLLGTPSGGGSARSQSFRVPETPFRVRLASMASFQPDGRLYDGHGVAPDLVVEPTPGYFVGKEDNVLDAAKKILLENR